MRRRAMRALQCDCRRKRKGRKWRQGGGRREEKRRDEVRALSSYVGGCA